MTYQNHKLKEQNQTSANKSIKNLHNKGKRKQSLKTTITERKYLEIVFKINYQQVENNGLDNGCVGQDFVNQTPDKVI